VQYLHHDQQGSTRLTTGPTGTVEGKCSYSAYGTPTCEGTTTPLGYDAQYTSADTGLIYMRARTYDPATAQFLTPDPLEAITGAPYNYVGDNPLNGEDPMGLACISAPVECDAASWLEERINEVQSAAGEAEEAVGEAIPLGIFGADNESDDGIWCTVVPPVGGISGADGAGSLNQMQRAIERGQAPRGIARVEAGNPDFPNSQDHVHFTGQRATLNRDGTWGHGDEGELTNEIEDWLRHWGWEIP
jgi:RHS repeat-associated protein